MRALLDTSTVGHLAPHRTVVRAAIKERRVELLLPHIAYRQIEANPDPDGRAFNLALADLCTLVYDGGFIVGVSGLGQARWGDAAHLNSMGARNPTHVIDAAIAHAYRFEKPDALVTADDRQARQAQKLMYRVWRPSDLLARLF